MILTSDLMYNRKKLLIHTVVQTTWTVSNVSNHKGINVDDLNWKFKAVMPYDQQMN